MKATMQGGWRTKLARLHAFLVAVFTLITIAACVSLKVTKTNFIAESRALDIGLIGIALLAVIGVVVCMTDTGDKQTPRLLIRSTLFAIIFAVLHIIFVPAI